MEKRGRSASTEFIDQTAGVGWTGGCFRLFGNCLRSAALQPFVRVQQGNTVLVWLLSQTSHLLQLALLREKCILQLKQHWIWPVTQSSCHNSNVPVEQCPVLASDGWW